MKKHIIKLLEDIADNLELQSYLYAQQHPEEVPNEYDKYRSKIVELQQQIENEVEIHSENPVL